MFFALPWMLLGLIGLPALIAIYWLRSRARPKTVSSLFLWGDQKQSQQGGRAFQRLQTPLLFFLEALAILAIVSAAALPAITRSGAARPLILVLDNSYSMQAGEKESSRTRAIQNLEEEFRKTNYVSRVILAGSRPQLLSEIVSSNTGLKDVFAQWDCGAPLADLESALLLAGEVGGETARILVMSDHPADFPLPADRVEWRGFGRPLKNVAITAATRDQAAGGTDPQVDRVLLEVTNFSPSATRAELTLTGAGFTAPTGKLMELAPGAVNRLILNVPAGTPPLQAQLVPDDLRIDDKVTLVSPKRQLLRVQLELQSDTLKGELTRALEASGQVFIVDSRPALIVTDHTLNATGDAWQLQFLSGGEPESFDGPFVFDRSHPLTAGLSLDAVIWSAGKEAVPAGLPVVTAGNRLLLTDQENSSGRHQVQIALAPESSTLTDNLDWPILVTNLIRWRLGEIPGASISNLGLGQPFQVSLSEEDSEKKEATILRPDGSETKVPISGRRLEWTPDQVGLHQLKIGETEIAFACNAVNAGESDLKQCETGHWGNWNATDQFQDQRWNLDWAFILVALLCLAVHMAFVSRAGGTGT